MKIRKALYKLWCKLFIIGYCKRSSTFKCEENPIPTTRYFIRGFDGKPCHFVCYDYTCLFCQKIIHTYVE